MAFSIPEGNPDHPDELARLPKGRHGLPPEFVEHNQRQRLLAALTSRIAETGYGEVTIESMIAGAGVSSRTFYKYFQTVEEAYIAAFEDGIEKVGAAVSEAFLSETEWPLAVRAALRSVLTQFSADPALARLLTAEPFVAGPALAQRHRAVIEQLVPYLRRGRELRGSPDPLPETTEKGLLGATSSMIGRLVFGGGTDLAALRDDLTLFILTPYLGHAEARRVTALD